MDSREFSVAAVRALNHSVDKTRTGAIRKLQESYNVKYGFLRNRAFYIRRATRNSLTAILTATGKDLPLIAFMARKTKTGVSVSVRKDRRSIIRHSFIARMPSGHSGVFLRDEKLQQIRGRLVGKRGPLRPSKHSEGIRELFTVSVPGMMMRKDIDAALEAMATTYFINEMERQGRLIIGRRGQ